ncbi:MAG: hypothetical protein ACP5H2_07580 [Solirubrobacteraceae bacterium]
MLVAVAAAVVAGVLIYVFISNYRKTVVLAPTQETVFVARSYIPPGIPEQAIIAHNLLRPERIPVVQAVAGVLTDPSLVAGQVTSSGVAAGQQVSISDFTHGSSALSSQFTGDQRAVGLSIDTAHGLTAYLTPGNYVDVVTQGPKGSAVLFQKVPILEVQSDYVVLQLSDRQVLLLADATQLNLTIWLELRPAAGATDSVKVNTFEALK